MQRLHKSKARKGRRRATMRADAEAPQIKGTHEGGEGRQSRERTQEAIQIKGWQREEKSDNKESVCGGCTNQGPAEGGEGRQ